jgi:hypothetical protein
MKALNLKVLAIFFAMSFILFSCGDPDDDGGNNNPPQPSNTGYSVRYVTHDETVEDNSIFPVQVLTANKALQICRYDNYYSDDRHVIQFFYAATQTSRIYSNNVWQGWMYSSYSYDYAFPENTDIPGYPPQTIEIAGKICNLISGTYDGALIEMAYWNGILMYQRVGTKIVTATAVTLDVPDKAFSEETIEVDWI